EQFAWRGRERSGGGFADDHRVLDPDPALLGQVDARLDRSTGGTKPATLETGATVQVPLFVTQGEKIKVDTRDGRYISRVNS
ncbi:MAG: hypothetical protein JO246_15950, partial [Frankiaceae bacterium]|nr:hypothetical protein [Frankiaceae bacterium]